MVNGRRAVTLLLDLLIELQRTAEQLCPFLKRFGSVKPWIHAQILSVDVANKCSTEK